MKQLGLVLNFSLHLDRIVWLGFIKFLASSDLKLDYIFLSINLKNYCKL